MDPTKAFNLITTWNPVSILNVAPLSIALMVAHIHVEKEASYALDEES